MRIKHVEIRNFRGIKSLCWTVKKDFNCIIGPGDTCKTTILSALDYALSLRSGMFFNDSDFFNQDVAMILSFKSRLLIGMKRIWKSDDSFKRADLPNINAALRTTVLYQSRRLADQLPSPFLYVLTIASNQNGL